MAHLVALAVWLAVGAGVTLLAAGGLLLALAVIAVGSGRLVTGFAPRRLPWAESWRAEVADFTERRVLPGLGVIPCHRCEEMIPRDPQHADVDLLREHLARKHPGERWQPPGETPHRRGMSYLGGSAWT